MKLLVQSVFSFAALALTLCVSAQTTVTLNLPAGGTQSYDLASHPNFLWDGAPWQGAWNSGTTYWMLDAVSFSGTNYQAVKASTNVTPGTDPTAWVACPDCGTGQGVLTAKMHDSTAHVGRADPSYPPFLTAKTAVDAWLAAHPTYATDSLPDLWLYDRGFFNCANAAIIGYQTQTTVYLTLSHFCLTHVEQFQASFQCDQTRPRCGEYNELYYQPAAEYNISIIREIAGLLLTSGEVTALGNKLFNDNDTSHNGLNTVSCTNTTNLVTLSPGTVSALGTSVTGSGTSFDGTYVGKILMDSAGQVIGLVASVGSSTSITLVENAEGGSGAFYALNQNLNWSTQTSACGDIWQMKHSEYFTEIPAGQEATFPTNYPTDGGDQCLPGTSTNPQISNNCYQYWSHAIGLAESFADDDPRAVLLLSQLYAYRITGFIGYQLSGWTGLDEKGAQYGTWVGTQYWPTYEWSLQKRIVGLPASLTGVGLTDFLNYYMFMQDPANNSPTMAGTGDNNGNSFQGNGWLMRSMAVSLYAGDATTANYAYDYLKNRTGQWTTYGTTLNYGEFGSYLPWGMTFFDPANAGTSPTGVLPTQYLFKNNDQSLCAAASTYCFSNSTFVNYNYWASKSDWTTTASLVFGMAPTEFLIGNDHGSVTVGAYHIQRNGFILLGGDGNVGGTPTNTNTPNVNGNTGTEDLIDIGGYQNFPIYYTTPVYGSILRWAGTNPSGDATSRYAYTLMDIGTASYTGGSPTRVQRHVVHFKKAGAQDYVVVYDDVATGTAETIKAYHHYFLNGQPYTSVITANLGARTMKNVQASAALLSSFLPVQGTNSLALQRDATDGSYPANGGHTYRVYPCASTDGSTCANATSMEEIAVHLPSTNTSATMPTLTQPSCSGTGGNCTAVQIADSTTPKVAVFARQGVTLTGTSFTSTFSGTGQYLIAGLTAGSYNVTGAVTTTCTVVANDNTCYFEGASGSVVVGAGSTPTATTPTFSPVAGTYSSTQSVTISTVSSGAIICYNTTGAPATNGTTGCTTGTLYTTPVSVSTSETLYAVAGGSGWVDSSVGSAAYVITGTAAVPTFSPTAGTYSSTQNITLSTATSGAAICYTLDGSTPLAATPGTCSHGTTYSTAVAVASSLTINALATKSGFVNSGVGSAAYVIARPSSAGIGGVVVFSGIVVIQ